MSSQWAELITQTLGLDPEICTCGSKMKVEDSVTLHHSAHAADARGGNEGMVWSNMI